MIFGPDTTERKLDRVDDAFAYYFTNYKTKINKSITLITWKIPLWINKIGETFQLRSLRFNYKGLIKYFYILEFSTNAKNRNVNKYQKE